MGSYLFTPGRTDQHPGTTLGDEYSRESLERDFAEREREDQDIERDIGDTNRGDERDPEREEYKYKADHPFARMCRPERGCARTQRLSMSGSF